MTNKTEKQLQRMTRKEIYDYAFNFCSERDLCKEFGGFQSKAWMIDSVLKRQQQITAQGN